MADRFHRTLLATAALAFLATVSAGMAGSHTLPKGNAASKDQTTPRRTLRRFSFTYEVNVPALASASSPLRIWLPLPHSSAHQSITHLRISSPVAYRVDLNRQYGDHMAYFDVPPGRLRKAFRITMHFDATRHGYRVDWNDPAGPGAVKRPADLQRFLEPDRLVPTGGIIAELAKQQTANAGTAVEKARAIYEYVIRTMHYDHKGAGWGRGDAIFACTMKHGNCTDFHSLFIAMVRSVGVPARFEIGFPLPENKTSGEIGSYHCWAEFWVNGVGWVPIDAAEAWLNPSRHNFYFGGLDADRVRFTYGRDLRLSPAQQGEEVNYFVYPYAELGGKPFSGLKSRFWFKDLPARREGKRTPKSARARK